MEKKQGLVKSLFISLTKKDDPYSEEDARNILKKSVPIKVKTPSGRTKTILVKVDTLVNYLHLNTEFTRDMSQLHDSYAPLEQKFVSLLVLHAQKYIDTGDADELQEHVETMALMVVRDEERLANFQNLIQRAPTEAVRKDVCDRAEKLPPADYTSINRYSDEFIDFLTQRSGLSTSVKQGGLKGRVEGQHFKKADVMLVGSVKAGLPLTIDLLKEMHQVMVSEPKKRPGELRGQGINVSAGPGMEYLSGSHVTAELTELLTWLDAATNENQGDRGATVEIAAKAYSWAVSIHPFCDGNGRTARLVMDYALVKGGLLPCTHASHVQPAVFGGLSPSLNDRRGSNPNDLVIHIMEGVENSYRLLGLMPPS